MTLPRPRSSAVFDGPDRAAARAYMKGIGFDDDALRRPTVGIANTWIEAMPCNFHLRELAEAVKQGVRDAGATPLEFNSIAISDGITMGTEGMKTSLVSREFIANSIACAFEAMGISPMGSAMVPAMNGEKADVAREAGRLAVQALADDLRPSKVITRESLENAIACVCASGGSTNGVLHLLAVAREAGIPLDIDDFERVSRRTPLLADLKPGGSFVATDLYKAGGVGVIAKRLADAEVLHGDALTVTGRTIGAEAEATEETPGQVVVRSVAEPIKPEGGFAILRGNLATDGS